MITRKKGESNHQAERSPEKDSILMEEKDDEGSEAEGIPGSKMFDHEEFKAQRQKLYESVVRWKRRIEYGAEHNVDEEKDHSYLMTIPEEIENHDATEKHDITLTNKRIYLRQETDIINRFGYQDAKVSEDHNVESEKVVVKVKEHKQRNMHQFNTHNVNGQEVLALFDSCSTLTLTHHGLIDKEKLGVYITTSNSISNMERVK